MRSDLKRLRRDTESGHSTAVSSAATAAASASGKEQTGASLRRYAFTRWIGLTLLAVGVLYLFGHFFRNAIENRSSSNKPALTQRQLTVNGSGLGVHGAAVSPDGKYLAYSDDLGLHLKLVQTGEMRTLPLPAEIASTHATWIPAAWFPDSTRLLTNLEVAGKPPSIWILSIIGEAPRKFRDESFAHAISPDGSTIVFTAARTSVAEQQGFHSRESGDETIWLIGVSGEAPRMLAQAEEASGFMQVVWSSDGNRIAYLKVHQTAEAFECAVEDRDVHGGPAVTVLSGSNLCQSPQGLWWAPDGRLIYSRAEQSPNENDSNLWQLQLDLRTGKPESKPARITSWVGFSFASPTGTTDGKRLTFLKLNYQSNVYVANLGAGGKLSAPRRLTLDERNDFPTSWSHDSRSVYFWSDRNGPVQIFKQNVDQQAAESMVSGTDPSWMPRVSPDGKYILFLTSPQGFESRAPRMMRVQSSADIPQSVLQLPRLGNFGCSRAPATLCFLGQSSEDGKKLTISSFDPLVGKPSEALTIDIHSGGIFNWMPAPDGSHIVFADYNSLEGKLRVLSLKGEPERDIVIHGWAGINSVDWAADGKSLFVSSQSPTSSTLLHVDMDGHATPLWDQRGAWRTWAIAAPNAHELAIAGMSSASNVWMIENF